MNQDSRIIFGLDIKDPVEAKKLALLVRDHVGLFKIGLEFKNASYGPLVSQAWEKAQPHLQAVNDLYQSIGPRQLFADEKLMDIPKTIEGAVGPIARSDVRMFNVHCLGGSPMLKAAINAADSMKIVSSTGERPIVLGVTILTSLNYDHLVELGFFDAMNLPRDEKDKRVRWLVRRLALLAQDCGLDGVVCSPQEIVTVRVACGPDFLIVTPGIRASDAPPDDQQRTMTPTEAITAGADWLVVSRPIKDHPPERGGPVEAAKLINLEIDEALRASGRRS